MYLKSPGFGGTAQNGGPVPAQYLEDRDGVVGVSATKNRDQEWLIKNPGAAEAVAAPEPAPESAGQKKVAVVQGAAGGMGREVIQQPALSQVLASAGVCSDRLRQQVGCAGSKRSIVRQTASAGSCSERKEPPCLASHVHRSL